MACQRTLPSADGSPSAGSTKTSAASRARQSEGNALRSAKALTSTGEVKPRTRGSGSRSCPNPFGMEPTQSTTVEATGIRPGIGATKRTVVPWSLIKTSTLVASGAGRAKIETSTSEDGGTPTRCGVCNTSPSGVTPRPITSTSRAVPVDDRRTCKGTQPLSRTAPPKPMPTI